MLKRVTQLWNGEEGASMIEYGLLVALISVVSILAITAIGLAINTKFGTVKASVGG